MEPSDLPGARKKRASALVLLMDPVDREVGAISREVLWFLRFRRAARTKGGYLARFDLPRMGGGFVPRYLCRNFARAESILLPI